MKYVFLLCFLYIIFMAGSVFEYNRTFDLRKECSDAKLIADQVNNIASAISVNKPPMLMVKK